MLNGNDYHEITGFKKIEISLKDIKKFGPSKEEMKRYKKVFKQKKVMPWEKFITKYDRRRDIMWLYNKIEKRLKEKHEKNLLLYKRVSKKQRIPYNLCKKNKI